MDYFRAGNTAKACFAIFPIRRLESPDDSTAAALDKVTAARRAGFL
jgi:hypothetical protein